MNLSSGVAVPTETIAEICRGFHIRELAIFGSATRKDFHGNSDIDIIVEFQPGFHPGLGWFDLEDQLQAACGHKVYVVQKALLRPRVRREAERDAVIVYAS